MKNKEIVASEHYEGLKELLNKHKYTSLKELLPSKEEFVKGYPLSAIGIVSIKKFWEICLSIGIVEHPFFEDESKFNSMEKELYDLCTKYMYSDDEDYSGNKFKEKVRRIFEKYNIET
jgi:hypothetical protein